MNCQKCMSDRIIDIGAKCSDLFSASHQQKHYTGYVPSFIGLGTDSDYVEFSYCADCGQIQGKFPLPAKATKIFRED
jgi:hypothetical protein